jgi:DNA replication protein
MMSLGKMPVDDLIRIAQAGGGFRLDAAHRYPDELMQIATAAKTGGATVIFSGMSAHYTDDLIRIATAGKGSVIFED